MSENNSSYEKKLQYNNAYNRSNYRSFSIRFDQRSEKEIIDWLNAQNGPKAYIKQLILQDMQKKKEK